MYHAEFSEKSVMINSFSGEFPAENMKGTLMMNKVKVTICGKEFSLKTDEAPDYFTKLAEKVDSEIYKMASSADNMSIQSAAVLVALSAFDEAQKANDSIDNIRTQIKEYVDDACKARLERDEALKNEKSLLARISALENELKIRHMKSDINEQLTLDDTKDKSNSKSSHNHK